MRLMLCVLFLTLAGCASPSISAGEAVVVLTEQAFASQMRVTRTAMADERNATATAIIRGTADALRFRDTQIAQEQAAQDLELTRSAATSTAEPLQTQAAETRTAWPPMATQQTAATATQTTINHERANLQSDVWFWFTVAAAGLTVVMLAASVRRWLNSRAVEAEQRATAIATEASAKAFKVEREAVANSVIVYRVREYIIIITDGRVTEKHHLGAQALLSADMPGLPSGESEAPLIAPPEVPAMPGQHFPASAASGDHLTTAQREMISFVRDAVRAAPDGERANYIPTDSSMPGYGGGTWSSKVAVLKKLGVVYTKGGRPKEGGYGTWLNPSHARDLAELVSKLERGLIVVPLPTHIVA